MSDIQQWWAALDWFTKFLLLVGASCTIATPLSLWGIYALWRQSSELSREVEDVSVRTRRYR